MAKSKLTAPKLVAPNLTGAVSLEGAAKAAPKVKAAKPFGSSVLVEMLNGDEVLGSSIIVRKDTAVGAPQGYVLALGPNLSSDVPIKVGDRVLLQGTFVPVPNYDNGERQKGVVELHNIKAVLEEVK